MILWEWTWRGSFCKWVIRVVANHRLGKKYDGPVPEDKKCVSGAHGRKQLALDPDEEKAKSAAIFYAAWQRATEDRKYKELLKEHKEKYP